MRKLGISLLVVTLLAILTLGWVLDRLFLSYTRDIDTTASVDIYRDLGQQVALLMDSQTDPSRLIRQWPNQDNLTLELIELESLPIPQVLATELLMGQALTLESDDDVTIYHYLPTHDLIVSLTTNDLLVVEYTSLRLLLTLAFYVGVGVLLLLWLFPLIKRLLALRHSAMQFGRGQLESRVSESRWSYISDIEHEFNKMAQRIQTLVTDNRLLSSAVSHDLRTPLARLRFGIDTLSEAPADAAQTNYINRMSDDIDAMEKLVNSLLSFAQLDHAMESAESTPIAFSDLVVECVELYAEHDINIQIKQFDEFNLHGNADFLAMLTNNLLQNAVKHARSQVIVKLSNRKSSASLRIEDDGPGIPPELRDRVMLPFQRGRELTHENPSITGSTPQVTGHGLGLAIVARLANWHGAIVQIADSRDLSGASISVEFRRVE